MTDVEIQKSHFFSCDQFDDVIRSISLNEQEKMGFNAFGQCFLLFPDTALKNWKIG